jgi:trigger factor
MQGQTIEGVRESLRADAEMTIKREMVVEAVADAEGITLTDDEVEARVRADAADAGRDAEELLGTLRKAGGWESLRQDLRVERAVDLIVESAVAISPEEAEKREAAAKPAAETTPAAKKPAAKKPAAKKPAAETKPAAKKPAEKKPAAKKPAEKKPAEKKPAAKKAATTSAKGSTGGAAKKPAAKKPASTTAAKPAAGKKKPESK